MSTLNPQFYIHLNTQIVQRFVCKVIAIIHDIHVYEGTSVWNLVMRGVGAEKCSMPEVEKLI